jgi:type I restriction enzyme S subunit
MSKLERLLKEICPKGVEYKKLGEVGTFTRGNGLQKKDFMESGVGCIHYGQVYTHYGLYAYETKSFVSKEFAKKLRKARTGDLVIATTSENDEDVCKAVAWLGKDEIAVSGDAFIYSHSLEPKFVSYFFQSQHFQTQKMPYITGAKVRRVNGDALEKIVIPVPPIKIQEEVVRILDAFSALEAELEAELEERRKQYQYYRDALLTSDSKSINIGTICMRVDKIKWKEKIDQDYSYIDLSSVSRDNSSISETQVINYKNAPSRAQQIIEEGDIIFGTTRPTLMRVAYIPNEYDGQICSTGFCVLRANREQLLPRYLYFHLTTKKFKSFVEKNQEGAGYPAISDSKVKSFEIPLPSLEEQLRIVSILDKFEGLVNGIKEGLPAEILARRQQYEYYRDQLLTFQEIA